MGKQYIFINELRKMMVDRFLAWPLPQDFSPDGGISFDRTFNSFGGAIKRRERGGAFWPIGTNLMTAEQAGEMIDFMMNGMLRPDVLAFALMMEYELRKKDAERGDSWKIMPPGDLLISATAQMLHAEKAIANGEEYIKHIVHAANYCMMIADVSGVLVTEEGNKND